MNEHGGTVRLVAHARAKVNLHHDVLRRRADGYHEVETILQSVDLYDVLDIRIDRSSHVKLTCNDPDVPTGDSNLCHRAIEGLRPLVGEDLGAELHIEKNIPVRAGLGGGSADAAAVILAVNRARGGRIAPEDLERVAAGLGADVPFMLYGGTMLGQGRGDRLTRLEPLAGGIFLIVKPSVDISTAAVYRDVKLTLTRHRYRINLKAVNTLLARFPRVALSFRNALEDVVCPAYPLVSEVLESLLASEPRFASMSGSGSALFAIYESETKASQLARHFSMRGFFTAVVEPTQRAVDIFGG